jgi:hypothetical protein
MLISGQGVPRQRARGLMWLTLAREAANPTKDPWVSELYEKAVAATSEKDRRLALTLLEQHLQARN